MPELFRNLDAFECPRGIVIAGTDPRFDILSRADLIALSDSLDRVTLVGDGTILADLPVLGRDVTYSIADRPNVFLLLGSTFALSDIPHGGTVFVAATRRAG